jgi:hypothetical protein
MYGCELVAEGVVAECRDGLRATVEDMHVLEEHHEQQNGVACLVDAVADGEQALIGQKGEGAHVEGGEQRPLHHQAVENRLAGRARRSFELVPLGRLRATRL